MVVTFQKTLGEEDVIRERILIKFSLLPTQLLSGSSLLVSQPLLLNFPDPSLKDCEGDRLVSTNLISITTPTYLCIFNAGTNRPSCTGLYLQKQRLCM